MKAQVYYDYNKEVVKVKCSELINKYSGNQDEYSKGFKRLVITVYGCGIHIHVHIR